MRKLLCSEWSADTINSEQIEGVFNKIVYVERICEARAPAISSKRRRSRSPPVAPVRANLSGSRQQTRRRKSTLARPGSRRACACAPLPLYRFVTSATGHETLLPFVRTRLDKGLSRDTVNRELAVVRHILNLAARVWCEEAGNPCLAHAPLIPVRLSEHPREPYPLSVGEQQLLFSELDGHHENHGAF